MSPLFPTRITPRGDHLKSNPRPQALCHRLYMLIPDFDLTACYPPDWEDKRRFRYLFSASPPDEDPSRFHESDARIWTHGHGSSRTAPYRVLSGECVVVVVGNYKFADSLTSCTTCSACTSGFATHVEAKSSPRFISIRYLWVDGENSIVYALPRCTPAVGFDAGCGSK